MTTHRNLRLVLPRQVLLVFILALCGLFPGFSQSLKAEEGSLEAAADVGSQQMITESGESKVLQPKDLSDSVYGGKRSDPGLTGAIVLFVVMLFALAGFWYYSKKGGVVLGKLASPGELRIRETKGLGNRQFLVVVEYGEQRMLLGVAPGVINHLCYLENPESLTSADAVDSPANNDA